MGKIWVYSTYGQFTRQHSNISYFVFSVSVVYLTMSLTESKKELTQMSAEKVSI